MTSMIEHLVFYFLLSEPLLESKIGNIDKQRRWYKATLVWHKKIFFYDFDTWECVYEGKGGLNCLTLAPETVFYRDFS